MKPMIEIHDNIASLKETISLLLDEIVYCGEDQDMNCVIDTVNVDSNPHCSHQIHRERDIKDPVISINNQEDLALSIEKMVSKKADATADAIAALSFEFSPIATSGSTVISSEKIEGSEPLPAITELSRNEETETTIDLVGGIKTLKSTKLVEKSLELETTEFTKHLPSNRRLSDIDQSPFINEQQLLPHKKLINSIYLNRIVSQYLPDLESLCTTAIAKLNDFVILDAIYCKNMQLNFQECHPGIFFHELCKKFEPMASDQHIALGIKCDLKFENDFIFADPMKLCTAFENLIVNAIENTPKHGIIQVNKYMICINLFCRLLRILIFLYNNFIVFVCFRFQQSVYLLTCLSIYIECIRVRMCVLISIYSSSIYICLFTCLCVYLMSSHFHAQ